MHFLPWSEETVSARDRRPTVTDEATMTMMRADTIAFARASVLVLALTSTASAPIRAAQDPDTIITAGSPAVVDGARVVAQH